MAASSIIGNGRNGNQRRDFSQLDVVMQRGLNPPPKHGPIFSHHKKQNRTGAQAESGTQGRENEIRWGGRNILPNDVAAGGQEVVGH